MSGDMDRAVDDAARYCADALEFAERITRDPNDLDAGIGLVGLATDLRSALHVVMVFAGIATSVAPELAELRGCDVAEVYAGWRRTTAVSLDAAEAIARAARGER